VRRIAHQSSPIVHKSTTTTT